MRFGAGFPAKKIAHEINQRQFGFTVFHNSRNGAHRNLYIKGYARIRANFSKAGIPEIFIANFRNKNFTIYKIGLNMLVRK